MASGIIYLLVVLAASCAHAQGSALNDVGTITLSIENDITDRTDQWYSSGVKFTWISPDLTERNNKDTISRWVNSCIEHLPYIEEPGLLHNYSISLGQIMYTPKDKVDTNPIEDDRPFAGISYLALGLHGRNEVRMDTLELDIGIVGPHSYAGQAQKLVHKIFNYYAPRGWINQLRDEPILNIYLDRKWKIYCHPLNETLKYDIIPRAGLALGNAFTAINAGAEVRVGSDIPDNYGTFLIGPGVDSKAPFDKDNPCYHPSNNDLGAHIFLGIDSYAVVRNIALDGNTFRDSQSVEKEPLVANLFAGFGLTYKKVKFTFAQVYRTKEFEKQDKGQIFGSLTVSYPF